MSELNVLDWVIVSLLLLGAVRGALIGLSRQVFSFAMLGAAVWASVRFQPDVAQRIAGADTSPDALARAVAYVLLFTSVCVGAVLLRMVGRWLFRFSFSPLVERLGGALLGLGSTALAIVAVLVLLTLIPHEGLHRVVAEESWSGRRVMQIFPRLYREFAEKYPLPEWAKEVGADWELATSPRSSELADGTNAPPVVPTR